jgi:hypothetical protein
MSPRDPRPEDESNEEPAASPYAVLPQPIRLESTRPSVDSQAPPDPTMGRNLKLDEALQWPG